MSPGTAERGLAGGGGGNPDHAIWGRGDYNNHSDTSAEGLPACKNPLVAVLPARHTCLSRRWAGHGDCVPFTQEGTSAPQEGAG